MKLEFDITPQEFKIVEEILSSHLTDNCQTWVFGSRVKNKALHNSDLDLALECKGNISTNIIRQIKTAFEQSKLPYRVDVLDINAVESYFRDIINQKKVCFPFEVKSKVPPLRFAEFDGDWRENKLGDIATFSKGKGISKSDIDNDGQLECIRYGELYTTYNELIKDIYSRTNIDKEDAILSKSGDVIIPASGETDIDIATASCVLKDGVAIGSDLNIIRSDIDGVFNAYYLNNKNKNSVARLSQGSSVIHIYSKHLEILKLNLPTKPEQQKIAAFLTAVDNKIEQLSKKQGLLGEYKKGVMQKIFSQTIRFKADDDSDFSDWEEKKLESLLDYEQPTKYLVNSTEYSNKYETPVLTAGKTFLLGYTNEDFGFFENVPVIIFDDFTTANKFVDFKFKAKSSAMKILNKNNNNVDVKFVYEAMQIICFSLGKEHKRYWISEYQKIKIKAPSFLEQTKIANFLSSIDNKTEQIGKQLDNSKQFKKALLQQMFV